MAAEEIAELVAVTAKLTAIMAEFEAAVLARGATLKELVERRPHRRSPDPGPRRRRRCFASGNGSRPPPYALQRRLIECADPPPPPRSKTVR